VIDWLGEDLSQKKDGGILRYQIMKGEGYASPNEGAMVEGMSRVNKPFIITVVALYLLIQYPWFQLSAVFSLEYSILLRIITLNTKERKCQSIATVQGVPGGKVNILGAHGISHSKQKCLYEHVSYSERFPGQSHLTV
jgi:hypothetical protein